MALGVFVLFFQLLAEPVGKVLAEVADGLVVVAFVLELTAELFQPLMQSIRVQVVIHAEELHPRLITDGLFISQGERLGMFSFTVLVLLACSCSFWVSSSFSGVGEGE